ncbi:hypothetical protein [Streptomyces sp. VRA16 Mangrove soil]|uniref:hypothetical protein n=1 Tax=Streptomyces sp. VRA16 Mangrove soil TaxID=2817434 RepID=UPI001A9E6CF3|nr:hypothetical protein [Streptomyces sp. VRA16 Mangrove soil]MBO1334683.1 hypothetical protein [Streptomyces sp. VRA16 Mangrove soil]
MNSTVVPGPVRRGMLVAAAVSAVISAVLLVAHVSFDGDTFRHCAYLGPSTRMYVTAWAGPVCSLAALVLTVRGGQRRTGAGVALVCLSVLLLAVQLLALYWVYRPDPSGGTGCSGLAALLA